MVKAYTLLALLFAGLVCVSLIGGATAQKQYHFRQEWAKIWIREDGSIDLLYNVSLTLDSGDPINWISIGQPRGDFYIDSAEDQYGNTLATEGISSGSNYQVKVSLHSPLEAGENIWFTLLTNVARMVYDDEMDLHSVATALEIPEGTVKSRLYHSRKQIAERLNGLDER